MDEEPKASAPLSRLSDLAAPDPLTALFSPAGLLTTGAMDPDASAAYLRQSVERARLSSQVPEEIRRSFDRTREAYLRGLFEYGLFTIADEAAWLLPEAALRQRFIEHYDGRVPFVRGSETSVLEARDFETVERAIARSHQYSRFDGWRLQSHAHYESGRIFDGSFWALLRWARREGLLDVYLGERWSANEGGITYAVITRVRPPDYAVPEDWQDYDARKRRYWWARWREMVWERDQLDIFVHLRNAAAHPRPEHTVMPVDAARTLHAVAAFINSLWSVNQSPNRPHRAPKM